VYYFRRAKGRRIRLPDYGAPEFQGKYDEALSGEAGPQERRSAASGTVGWLVDRYRESASYGALSYATRRQRDNIFRALKEKAGFARVDALTKQKIVEGREDRKDTPHQARHFLDALRGMFAWAVEAEMVAADPTSGVKNPARGSGDGFEPWTEDDVVAYLKRWKRGTRERVWLRVLETGLRRGDAVVFGRQHVKDGWAKLKTEKTGMEVYFPIPEGLAEAIEDGPIGDLAYVTGQSGGPLTKETFGNFFREACSAAGIRKSAHGLRKLAATRAVEHGLTPAELDAMFGWADGRMSSHYTKKADRLRLAKAGAEKIRNGLRPHLEGGSPHPEKTKAGSRS
jgi:integrase